MMDALKLLVPLLPLSFTSGINLYATVFVAGLSMNLGWVQNVPSELHVLASWPVVVVAGALWVLEFLAGFIPGVDNFWDFVHTFIRPFGAAFLGLKAVGQLDPAKAVIAALMAGSVAIIAHGGKAGSRLTVNAVSPLENGSNAAITLGENVIVVWLVYFALTYPLLAAAIALLILILIVIFVPRLLRWAWFTLKAFFSWLKALVRKKRDSDLLPSPPLVLLNHRVLDVVSRCKAQHLKGANGRSGYLAIVNNCLIFTYDSWFQSHIWYISLRQIKAACLRKRLLIDVLEIHYRDAKQGENVVGFVFTRDRAPLLKELAAGAGATDIIPPLHPAAQSIT